MKAEDYNKACIVVLNDGSYIITTIQDDFGENITISDIDEHIIRYYKSGLDDKLVDILESEIPKEEILCIITNTQLLKAFELNEKIVEYNRKNKK